MLRICCAVDRCFWRRGSCRPFLRCRVERSELRRSARVLWSDEALLCLDSVARTGDAPRGPTLQSTKYMRAYMRHAHAAATHWRQQDSDRSRRHACVMHAYLRSGELGAHRVRDGSELGAAAGRSLAVSSRYTRGRRPLFYMLFRNIRYDPTPAGLSMPYISYSRFVVYAR